MSCVLGLTSSSLASSRLLLGVRERMNSEIRFGTDKFSKACVEHIFWAQTRLGFISKSGVLLRQIIGGVPLYQVL